MALNRNKQFTQVQRIGLDGLLSQFRYRTSPWLNHFQSNQSNGVFEHFVGSFRGNIASKKELIGLLLYLCMCVCVGLWVGEKTYSRSLWHIFGNSHEQLTHRSHIVDTKRYEIWKEYRFQSKINKFENHMSLRGRCTVECHSTYGISRLLFIIVWNCWHTTIFMFVDCHNRIESSIKSIPLLQMVCLSNIQESFFSLIFNAKWKGHSAIVGQRL